MLTNMKVYLRALELEDYKNSIEWRQDEEIWDMLVGRRYYVSEEAERKWIKEAQDMSSHLKLAICDIETDQYVGNIILRNIDYFNKSASFGILIGNRNYWSGGYGTHATFLLLKHAFYDLGLERIQSIILTSNIASIKMHEKCGFSNEGTLRKSTFKNGSLQDLNLMSILREDFDEVLKSIQSK